MERHCYQHVEIFLLVETELLSAVERSLWTTQLISGEGRREVFDECSLSVNTRHGDSFLTEQNASEVISSICRRATANKKWVNVLLFLLLDLAFFSPRKRCCALRKRRSAIFVGDPCPSSRWHTAGTANIGLVHTWFLQGGGHLFLCLF